MSEQRIAALETELLQVLRAIKALKQDELEAARQQTAALRVSYLVTLYPCGIPVVLLLYVVTL